MFNIKLKKISTSLKGLIITAAIFTLTNFGIHALLTHNYEKEMYQATQVSLSQSVDQSSQNELAKLNIILTQTQLKENINNVKRQVIEKSHQFDMDELHSVPFQIELLCLSLLCSLLINIPVSLFKEFKKPTKEQSNKKWGEFFYNKLTKESKFKITEVQKCIKAESFYTKKSISLKELAMSLIYEPLHVNDSNFKVKNLNKWDKIYVSLFVLCFGLMLKTDIGTFSLFALLACAVIALQTSLIHQNHFKKFIKNHYQQLSQSYPTEILNYFIDEYDEKKIEELYIQLTGKAIDEIKEIDLLKLPFYQENSLVAQEVVQEKSEEKKLAQYLKM